MNIGPTSWVVLAIGFASLAGCGPTSRAPDAQDAAQQIKHRCVGLGFFPGTRSYDQCAKEVADQRGIAPAATSPAPELRMDTGSRSGN